MKPKPNKKLGCILLALLVIFFTPWQAGWLGVVESCTVLIVASVLVAQFHRKE